MVHPKVQMKIKLCKEKAWHQHHPQTPLTFLDLVFVFGDGLTHSPKTLWSDQKVQQPGSVIGCVSAHGHLHLVETTFMQKGPKFYTMSFLISSKPNSAPVTPLCNKGGVIANI